MRSTARTKTRALKTARKALHLSLLTLAIIAASLWAALAEDENIIVSHGFSTFGDLKYPADFPHLNYVNPDAPKGGEFSTFALGSFDNIHRYTSKGDHAGSATIFFEPLMVGLADEVDSVYGLIAETIEYPEDRQWAIFNLRPEAKFSDGTPVTAEDVVFSHTILIEEGIPSLRIIYQDIESVEALDTHRVKFTFKEGADTKELPSLAAGTPVFSKAWWSGTDKDGEPRAFGDTTLEAPLGTGPYILDKMDPGRMISYKRNPDYWGNDLAINVGQNNFDRIRYEYYADRVAAQEGFKAGSYTFRSESSSQVWATGYDFPAHNDGYVLKKELPDGTLANAQSYVFNLRLEKFQDPKIREAMGLMFNFEWSNRTLFYDLYARVDSFWGNSDMEADGPPSPEELAILQEVAEYLPESVLTEPALIPPVSDERQLDRRLLRRASALMDEAGWGVSDDGMRVNDAGERLSVEILYFSPAFERIHGPFAENLKRLGIDVVLTQVDSAAYSNRLETFDFELITQSIITSPTPGIDLLQWFHSDGANVNTGNRNLAGFSNPGIDILVDRVIASQTREELTLNTRVLDRAMRSLQWTIPQWFKDVHTVAYWDMFEHPAEIPPLALGQTTFWWFNQEKADALKAAGAL